MKSFKISAYIISILIGLAGIYGLVATPDKIESALAILASVVFILTFNKFTK